MSKANIKNGVVEALPKPALLNWEITSWQMNGREGWIKQPIILVEGRTPFFADHPQAYIDELVALRNDPALLPFIAFHTVVGQLQDGLEWFWKVKSAGVL